MTQLKDGGRQPGNREERSLSASTVIARWQGNGWDEPCKSRGLRTVLWAAGGEIPGQYIIGTQEYGRFYLKKGMSFGLHKRAFLKTLDGIRQRATLSLS
jgi:hypothetical protein